MTYSYDPANIGEKSRDRMRFELGDTTVDGGADTCALSDEEYDGLLMELTPSKRSWMHIKLYALEAIAYKMSYQVDTSIDGASFKLGARAEHFARLLEQQKKLVLANAGVPSLGGRSAAKPPYFHVDMGNNTRVQPPLE